MHLSKDNRDFPPKKSDKSKEEISGKMTRNERMHFAHKTTKPRKSESPLRCKRQKPGPRWPGHGGKMGISKATFYRQEKKDGGLAVSEFSRLKQLGHGQASHQLRKLVADLICPETIIT